MLPANFLPASDSFVDTATVRSANFANSTSLPYFAVSATFTSQTGADPEGGTCPPKTMVIFSSMKINFCAA